MVQLRETGQIQKTNIALDLSSECGRGPKLTPIGQPLVGLAAGEFFAVSNDGNTLAFRDHRVLQLFRLTGPRRSLRWTKYGSRLSTQPQPQPQHRSTDNVALSGDGNRVLSVERDGANVTSILVREVNDGKWRRVGNRINPGPGLRDFSFLSEYPIAINHDGTTIVTGNLVSTLNGKHWETVLNTLFKLNVQISIRS